MQSKGPSLSRSSSSMRKATLDVEALSVDHEDQTTPTLSGRPTTLPQSQRRTSWLGDIKDGFPRRPSLANSLSNPSQPATPSSEAGAWPIGIPLGRVSSNPTSSTWSTGGLWSSLDQSRGSISSRYLDMTSPVQSNVTTRDPNMASSITSSMASSITSSMASFASEHSTSKAPADSTFPFQIPLHPTPKTYRSQSYSVGQAEVDSAQAGGLPAAAATSVPAQGLPVGSRQRLGSQPQSLWHRPSRPSMLSEVHQGNNMSALHEESDDLETHRDPAPATTSQELELSEQTPTATNAGPSSLTRSILSDDSQPDLAAGLARRFSEMAGLEGTFSEGDNAATYFPRKSPWQSSLGFGELGEPTQSRRHSMAQIPMQMGSQFAGTANTNRYGRTDRLPSLETSFRKTSLRGDRRIDPIDEYAISPTSGARYDDASAPPVSMPTSYPVQSRTSHQHHHHQQGMFTRPGQETRLFLVTFKNMRADVYFVAPSTGLQVCVGDDVIVEADRGHDLGTVQYAGLSWVQAKEVKQQATEEHYYRLMAGSRHPETAAHGQQADAARPGRSGHAGGAGSDMTAGSSEADHGPDLKPKMIKRLAQSHETATRRDKESNEAKARRLCQQKVLEHGLDMEILDAEFQMDWKKLTFCYYAHSYVNFNILVTELFKIYKTRIWMSAVNPASLSTPTSGGRGSALESGAHRGGSLEGVPQDMDPAGAVPPNMNPSTNAFYEYAYATRNGGQNSVPPPYRQPFPGPFYQADYTTQPGMGYWSDASGSFLGTSQQAKMPQQYNIAAAPYHPMQASSLRDQNTGSPYQEFGAGGMYPAP